MQNHYSVFIFYPDGTDCLLLAKLVMCCTLIFDETYHYMYIAMNQLSKPIILSIRYTKQKVKQEIEDYLEKHKSKKECIPT